MDNRTATAKNYAQLGFDPDWMRMLPSEAIQHKYFLDEPEYAASWDLFVTSTGRIFFPLCAELYYPMKTRLYEYIPENDEFKLHFRIEDVTFQQERAISTSKIHTSLTELPDGRLLMTTHTTARSVLHPDWMPQAYHAHPFEGYQGSHIILYDYIHEKAQDLGIPVPFESIYGAKYDVTHNCLYFTGFLRGHLYRYDLDTNRVTDYGKVTEFGSYRISEGPDGNFYSSSRSGDFYRINLQTQQIEQLGIEVPNVNGIDSTYHRIITYSFCAAGKLYLHFAFVPGLWAYDPAENTLTQVGDLRPFGMGAYAPKQPLEPYRQWIFGLALDDEDCLWYGYSHGGIHLVRWDFLHGGQPENMGIIGTPPRGAVISSEMIYKGGKLYISDTNHLLDGPGVAIVDLEKLKAAKAAGQVGPISEDPFLYLSIGRELLGKRFPYAPREGFTPIPMENFYPGENLAAGIAHYIQQEDDSGSYVHVIQANPYYFPNYAMEGILLWRELSVELSQVHYLHWQDNHTLIAQVGSPEGEKRELTVVDGRITGNRLIHAFTTEPIPEFLMGLPYPCHPGRQYKAVPSAYAPWKDGSYLVGTQDGMLALVREDKSVFALGNACTNGPIHQITVSEDQSVAYGVTGDPEDMGNVFSFDDRAGLRSLGMVHRDSLQAGMTLSANQLYRVAISPDKSTLAIGTLDRKGGLYLYDLNNTFRSTEIAKP